jgi:small ligand-binding sensory domain FIST
VSRFLTAVSIHDRAEEALQECLNQLEFQVGSPLLTPDLALLFYTGYREEVDRLPLKLRRSINPKNTIGCSGFGVLDRDGWREGGRALSLTLAYLPDVDIQSFSLQTRDLPNQDSSQSHWANCLGVNLEEQPDSLIVLAENSSFDVEGLLTGLDFSFPQCLKFGTLAGSRRPMATRLILDSQTYSRGCVGLALTGLKTSVWSSQGCRPIGQPFVVEAGERSLLRKLSGLSALDALQKALNDLSRPERERFRKSIVVGFPQLDLSDLFSNRPSSNRCILRNLIGADIRKGTLAVAAPVRVGQQIQFYVRDPGVAERELDSRFHDLSDQNGPSASIGALVFSGHERGTRFHEEFEEPAILRNYLGKAPTFGVLGGGEILGNSTSLSHRFSTQVALFTDQ